MVSFSLLLHAVRCSDPLRGGLVSMCDGSDCCTCTCLQIVSLVARLNLAFALVISYLPPLPRHCGFCPVLDISTSGYDGGDCCECTCVTTDFFECGEGYHGGYTCIDPGAECVDEDDVTDLPTTEDTYDWSTTTSLGCVPGYFADGYCDRLNNNEECGTSHVSSHACILAVTVWPSG